jgi:hypothetical protein
VKRTPLKRKSWIRRSNPDRKAKRYARDFGPLADYVRGLDCCACGAAGPSDPAHVRSRGAGGHAWTDDGRGNIIPLCRACHGRQHAKGWSALDPGGRAWGEAMADEHGRDFSAHTEQTNI